MGFFKKLFHGDWSNPFDNAASGTKNIFETNWNKGVPILKGMAVGGAALYGGGAMGWGEAAKLFGPMAADFVSAQQANEAAKQNAREQMEFQERMSSTAYQRAMADMRAGGLNPSLAYMQGGASTPGGAAAPVMRSPAGELLSSGIQGASQRKLQDAQAKSAIAAARNTDTDTDIKKYTLSDKLPKEVENLVHQTQAIDAQRGVSEAQSALYDAQRQNRLKELEEQAARIAMLKSQGKSAEAQAAYDIWRTKGQMVLAPTVDEGIEVLRDWLHGVIHGKSGGLGYEGKPGYVPPGSFKRPSGTSVPMPFDRYQGY